MHHRFHNFAIVTLSLLALTSLSACAQAVAPTAPKAVAGWENVHDGLLIGNIYTGDDHI